MVKQTSKGITANIITNGVLVVNKLVAQN